MTSRVLSLRRQFTTFNDTSQEGLRQFFAWLETRYGGLVWDTGPAAEVIQAQHDITAHDLGRLLRHEATALHVKQFFPKRAAAALGRQLAAEVAAGGGQNWKVSTSRGLESSDVATLGAHPPFNVAAAHGAAGMAQYFDAVPLELRQRRQLDNANDDGQEQQQQPALWPLDLLRLALDEVWPAGAGLARDETRQRVYSGGLPRVMQGPTRWKRGYIHVDEMGPLNPANGLFSANIYLQLPSDDNDNGEQQQQRQQQQTDGQNDNHDTADAEQDILQIWPLGIRSRWDWYRNALLLSGLSSQDAADQARLRHQLGKPTILRGQPGDLILLCVQRPHAAVGFSSGIRVSLQCFLQHKGPKERLLIDS